MEIKGPGKTSGVVGASKSKKKSQGDGASFQSAVEEGAGASDTSQAAGASASQSLASLDVLLAVQGAEDPTQKSARKKMKQRGHKLLDILENMRMALLNGNITVGHMISLADTIATHRENITDPELMGILDEIDLRAQIEMAKMSRALDSEQSANIA